MNRRSWMSVLVFLAIASASPACNRIVREGDGCSTLPNGWIERMNLPGGSYWWTNAGAASNGHSGFMIIRDDGAVWATDVDPSVSPTSGGLLVPLNEQARNESNAGADLSDGAIRKLFPHSDLARAARMVAEC